VSWSLSFIVVGLLLKLLYLAGDTSMLMTGLASSLIVLLISAFFYNPSKKVLYKSFLSRLIPFTLVATVLLFTPTPTLIDFFERNDPERAQEEKALFKNRPEEVTPE
jgi:large-conductance mechanosensitive channel